MSLDSISHQKFQNLFYVEFSGTLISILSIELKNINDEIIKVPFSKVFMSLENAFIINNQNIQKIFVNSYDDEKISFKFNDEFKDISQIN